MRSLAMLAALAVGGLPAEVKITPGGGRIDVEIDGKPFTTFYVGEETTKPFLHPVRAASGTIVSRVWPMEEKAGEAKDHPHHQGLWFTHGDVNGIDFWANAVTQKSPKKGRIVLEKVTSTRSGKREGTIAATFAWQDPAGKTLLREERTMVFHGDAKLRIIDFDIRLKGVETAKFGDTKEGTFAIRLTAPLDGRHSGKMVSAEGKVGEKEVWGQRSPWVDYWGQIDGETLGVTIMDHPANPKHPTYWHSRDYGLFAANIFGERDFYRDKARDGSLTLAPGQEWRFRYRVLVHPGDTQSAGIAGLYAKWAKK